MRALALFACATVSGAAMQVLVTGAGGRTGSLVFSQLKHETEHDSIEPVGLARSKRALKALRKAGATREEIIRADATQSKESLVSAMRGCEGVVLCTSAVPSIRPLSLVKLLFTKYVRRSAGGRPAFKFARGGTPEEVDWLGAKLQIDAAVEAGVKRFVFVSSMGGSPNVKGKLVSGKLEFSRPENFLNTIGRRPDGTGGDILLWKRKAERYLIESGLTYTIIHPGGLVDEPPSARELVVGVDDEMLQLQSRSVARADVARVCCAALVEPAAANKSFDLASREVGVGTPTRDARSVFATLGARTCDYGQDEPDPPSIFAGASTSVG